MAWSRYRQSINAANLEEGKRPLLLRAPARIKPAKPLTGHFRTMRALAVLGVVSVPVRDEPAARPVEPVGRFPASSSGGFSLAGPAVAARAKPQPVQFLVCDGVRFRATSPHLSRAVFPAVLLSAGQMRGSARQGQHHAPLRRQSWLITDRFGWLAATSCG